MQTILRPVTAAPTAATADLTDSLTVAVDGTTVATLAALHRLDLAAPAVRALQALDVVERVALMPAERIAAHAFDAFAAPGHVKVQWELQVEPSADEGAYVSLVTRFAATDARSRARLLDAWALVGPLSRSLAERAVRTVTACAEDDALELPLAA